MNPRGDAPGPAAIQGELAAVERALSALRVSPAPQERELHRLIAGALEGAGLPFLHEARLGPRCRIDFLAGRVGIEVKKGKVNRRLLRAQAEKYLAFQQVEALLLVTGAGADLPGLLQGKPVKVFGLNRLWGVALP